MALTQEEALVLAFESSDGAACDYCQSVGVAVRFDGGGWSETVQTHARFRLIEAEQGAVWSGSVEEYYSDVFPASGSTFEEQAAMLLVGSWDFGVEGSASTDVTIWPLDGDPLAEFSCQ
jgi:hypothetical protein